MNYSISRLIIVIALVLTYHTALCQKPTQLDYDLYSPAWCVGVGDVTTNLKGDFRMAVSVERRINGKHSVLARLGYSHDQNDSLLNLESTYEGFYATTGILFNSDYRRHSFSTGVEIGVSYLQIDEVLITRDYYQYIVRTNRSRGVIPTVKIPVVVTFPLQKWYNMRLGLSFQAWYFNNDAWLKNGHIPNIGRMWRTDIASDFRYGINFHYTFLINLSHLNKKGWQKVEWVK